MTEQIEAAPVLQSLWIVMSGQPEKNELMEVALLKNSTEMTELLKLNEQVKVALLKNSTEMTELLKLNEQVNWDARVAEDERGWSTELSWDARVAEDERASEQRLSCSAVSLHLKSLNVYCDEEKEMKSPEKMAPHNSRCFDCSSAAHTYASSDPSL
nr:hypothetical protein Iba_chr10eCG6620 [Ipomoea batatas]